MKNSKTKKGFTLVELLVVMSVIAILTLLAVPRFLVMTKQANLSTVEANHRSTVSAISMYIGSHKGELPPTGLTALKKYLDIESGKPKGSTYSWTNNGDGTGKLHSELDAGNSPTAGIESFNYIFE